MEDDEDTNEYDCWKPAQRPCRFLLERMFESKFAGIPAGVENYCNHPIWASLAQMLVVHISLKTLSIELLQIARENNFHLPPNERAATLLGAVKAMDELISKYGEIIADADKNAPSRSDKQFFTKTPEKETPK